MAITTPHWHGVTAASCGQLALAVCLLLTLQMSAGAHAAEGSAPLGLSRSEELDELDEARVKATKLWQMREKMVALEEQFYARYNELNKDNDFDVHCAMEAPLGTRLKKRVCRIQFFEDAQAEEARAFLDGSVVQSADMVTLQRKDEFKVAMLAVINSDNQLRKLIREREELEKRYIAERKRRFKGRWILFE